MLKFIDYTEVYLYASKRYMVSPAQQRNPNYRMFDILPGYTTQAFFVSWCQSIVSTLKPSLNRQSTLISSSIKTPSHEDSSETYPVSSISS